MAGSYYVDTFAGSNEAIKNLGAAFDTMQEQRRKDELLKIQQAEEARKQAEFNRTEETRTGLAAIDAKRSQMTQVPYSTPNPGLKSYLDAHTDEALAADKYVPQSAPSDVTSLESGLGLSPSPNAPQPPSAAGLASLAAANGPVPAATTTQMRTEQLYGNDELQRQKAQYLEGRGDWAGLKGMENAIDVTSKVDARSADLVSKLHKVAMDARAKGGSTESIRATVKSMAENINRMQGKQVFDPATVDGMDFSPRGDLMMQTMPDGTKIVSTLKTDGTVDFKFVPQDTSKATWTQLPDKTINGVHVMPQQNDVTGEMKYTQVSRVPASIVNGGSSIARETAVGVVPSGPYAGQTVYKDSRQRGGAPFVILADPNDPSRSVIKPIPGVPYDTRPSTGAYLPAASGEPVTAPVAGQPAPAPQPELTPAQKKANMKGQNDPTSMRIAKRIAGVQPVLESMATEFEKLPLETGLQPINNLLRTGAIKLGNVKLTNYDTFVKEATREVQSALAGNQASQTLVLQQIDVLSKAKTNAQRAGAIRTIINILDERKKAELAPIYAAPQAAAAPAAPKARPGFKIQSRTVNGKTEYREVPQ